MLIESSSPVLVFDKRRCCVLDGWVEFMADADTSCDAFGSLASCGSWGAPGQVLVSTLQFQLLAVTFLRDLA